MIGVTILGATGSIGGSTLDVLARNKDKYQVIALTANRNVQALLALCEQFRPKIAVLADPDAAQRFRQNIPAKLAKMEVLSGPEGLAQVARMPEADYVMAAVVGAAGLLPTLAAVQAGKRVLLANKEALVMSGPLFMAAVQQSKARLLPIDSEHNALFQCMPAAAQQGQGTPAGVRRVLLTASGGPFRTTPIAELATVTPEQAVAHPNWAMGRKISVDSATMMNKGLEVIEACWLFGLQAKQVEVVIHPQSVVHSLVEYVDGSVLSQMGNPDMRTPIAHALAWPERISAGVSPLQLQQVSPLQFEPPDHHRFPCLALAYQALQQGGTAPAILNAANEIAVAAFLARKIAFTAIPTLIEQCLAQLASEPVHDLDHLLKIDQQARETTTKILNKNL